MSVLLVLAALFAPVSATTARAQDSDGQTTIPFEAGPTSTTEAGYLFYQPDITYGSASLFSPLNVVATRGFSTLMWSDAERHPLRIDWGNGLANVWDAVFHPRSAIERSGGMELWLRTEFLPDNWNVWGWAFAPNYAGHMVAGGITSRALREWADAHGVPAPKVFGAVGAMATILVNETIESRYGSSGYSSTTADLLINEPIGIVLFDFLDGPSRYFSRHLHAADWSPQASITLPKLQLLNNSQLMAYHAGLPFTSRFDWLIVTGQGTQMGVLYDVGGGYQASVAGGFTAESQLIDDESNESVVAKAAVGLYVVRNNSLLMNLNVFRGGETMGQLNLYPGLLSGAMRDVGVWSMVNRGGDFSLGLSYRRMLGLGLGYDFWKHP